MKINAAQAGFIKGIFITIIVAVSSYLAQSANLEGVMNPVIATLIAAIASSLESHMKATSGGNTALFGAVTLKK